MKSMLIHLAHFALLCRSSDVFATDKADSVENSLDAIQSGVIVIFMGTSEQIEALTNEIHALKQSLDHLGRYSEKVRHSVTSFKDNNELLLRNLTILTYRSNETIANQHYCANHEALKNLFYDLAPKCGAFSPTPKPPEPQVIYNSCADAPYRSGVYELAMNGFGRPFKAYCEMDLLGGGWTVFQKRQDGSIDFNRSWIEYREGFGEVSGEYWLGLEMLHQLTTQKQHELLIVLENFNGSTSYARYAGVVIDSEALNYRIYLNSSGSGSAADSLYPYRGEIFVTPDVVRGSFSNCAKILASGFWHYHCSSSTSRNNLNGVYGTTARKNGIWWYNSFKGYYQYNPLKGTQMLIREKVN